MADPTPEELAEAGVEIDAAPAPDLFARIAFEQVDDLPNEPKTDVKIRLENGTELRERLVRLPSNGGFNLAISNALLTKDGEVAQGSDGEWRIHPHPHEFFLSGEALALLGTKEKIDAALRAQREIAAAQAHAYFVGMDIGENVFADRLGL